LSAKHPKQARLVLFVPTFPKVSETFIVNKFLGLLERGWDVHVVCQSVDERCWKRFSELEHRADLRQRVHAGWPSRPRWSALLLAPWVLLRCLAKNARGTLTYLYRGRHEGLRVLRKLYSDAEFVCARPSVIHFEFGALAASRTYLRDWLDCKLGVAFRGYDLNFVGLDEPGFYQAVWDRADALHLLGRDLWNRALARGCAADMPHALIPPAIDTAFFNAGQRDAVDAVGTEQRPLRILSVGRLEWKKGYEYALQAVRRLVDNGIQCEHRIAGDGAYSEPLAFARHQLGLDGVVEFLGSCTRQEIRSKMLWADVLVHASVSEGFCNAVLEAQGTGLPVVCTDADGLGENVDDGCSGFVVPRRDPEALARAIEKLARNAQLRRRFGQAGRQRVLEHFGLPQQVEAFDWFYRGLLESESHAGAASVRARQSKSTELVQAQ
jgi:colanic acid/amylovoran biosynthesis glycosyltransferase